MTIKQTKRNLLVFFLTTTACVNVFAQGYLSDATTGNAVLSRDPARQASTEIDAVITNPAGTSFLGNGFHFSLNGIYSCQKISSNLIGENAVSFHSRDNRVLPAIQFAFKKDRWSISASFSCSGGYGNRKMKDGSLFANYALNYLMGGEGILEELNSQFQKSNEILLLLANLSGLPEPDINSKEDRYVFSTNNLSSSFYNWKTQLGGSYRITDNFSAYIGIKANHIVNNTKVPIDIQVSRTSTGQSWRVSQYNEKGTEIINSMDIDDNLKKQYQETSDKIATTLGNISAETERKTSGWGFAPILGLDYKLEKFNFGIKYEFATRINVKGSDSHFNIPSILSFGADWLTNEHVKLAAGSNIIFGSKHGAFIGNSQATTYDISASCTYNINRKFLVSGGLSYVYEQKIAPEIMSAILDPGSNYRLSLGLAYTPIENLRINLGISTFLNSSIYNTNYNYKDDAQSVLYSAKYDYAPRLQVALGINYHI